MISGVRTHDIEELVDERGRVLETWRTDWDVFEDDLEMSYMSVTRPGVIRAWARHVRGQDDYFVVPHGRIKVGVYDEREDSPTRGELDVFYLGEGNMKLLRIPGDCWHGFKVVSEDSATLINYITELYDYDDPDHERLPYDTERIPLNWDDEPHSSGSNPRWDE